MFDKNEGKLIRQPIGDSPAGKQIRPNIGKNLKLDSEIYEREYPDKVLFKENDIDGQIQWWLDRGAEPVPRKIDGRKTFKGINDKQQAEWVTWYGGSNDGTPFKVYLLMMDPEIYHQVKKAPEEQRRADIRNAMKMGVSADNDRNSYAPNLPVGVGTGFNEIRR